MWGQWYERRGKLCMIDAYSPHKKETAHPGRREAAAINNQLGLGIGLRNVHFDHILNEQPNVDWFEAISENFMDSNGRPRAVIRKIAENYPIVLHGVSMSIGSTDPLDIHYLSRLKNLADELQARWVSDHLCWTGVQSVNSHDLLPLPMNEETLQHVISRVLQVQEHLARPLVLENPSTYVRFRHSTLSEPEFLKALCAATDCKLLLDVNNVYVSCFNAGTSPQAYLAEFPFKQVIQMHLAGHQHCGTHIIDTHDQPVSDDVWALFQTAWQRSNGAATLLEWDGDVPAFDEVHKEILQAKYYMNTVKHPVKTYQSAPSHAKKSLSTPIDFMLPDIMGNSRVHNA